MQVNLTPRMLFFSALLLSLSSFISEPSLVRPLPKQSSCHCRENVHPLAGLGAVTRSVMAG